MSTTPAAAAGAVVAATSAAAAGAAAAEAPEVKPAHAFWDTQPVVKPEEVAGVRKPHHAPNEPVDFSGTSIQVSTVDQVPVEPLPLASVLEWFTFDITDEAQLDVLYHLLHDHYVEDDESMFRFDYSHRFLRWALSPPGYYKDWHVGVRRKDTKEVLAFISGVPCTIRVGTTKMRLCEINFLCVSKKLRDKRLAPILIKEVTRRVHLCDIWHAVYTAGREVPTPFSTTQYFHRALNAEKLVDVKFSHIPPMYEKFEKPMEMYKRGLAIDAGMRVALRPMTEADLPAVKELMTRQLESCAVAPDFDLEELKHWMLTPPADNIVTALVREHPQTKLVSDFVSFYQLSSSVLKNERHNTLRAAYAYYWAATSVDPVRLFNEVLLYAREQGFDVFNALNIMANEKFLAPLKFHVGDGRLRYYLYNWKFTCLQVEAKAVGLVMV
jgi:glycylpeptide N-tetradecanoyltransferase